MLQYIPYDLRILIPTYYLVLSLFDDGNDIMYVHNSRTTVTVNSYQAFLSTFSFDSVSGCGVNDRNEAGEHALFSAVSSRAKIQVLKRTRLFRNKIATISGV